jgi:hypothetical protein
MHRCFLFAFGLLLMVALGAGCGGNTGKTTAPKTVLDSIFQAIHFDTTVTYEPCCLMLNDKPFVKFGMRRSALDSLFTFNTLLGGRFAKYPDRFSEGLAFTNAINLDQTTGSLNGTFFVSSENYKGRVIGFHANWVMITDFTPETVQEAIDSLGAVFFPCIAGKMTAKDTVFTVQHPHFDEIFSVTRPEKPDDHHWGTFSYDTELK